MKESAESLPHISTKFFTCYSAAGVEIKPADLVVAMEDQRHGLLCLGLVLETRHQECYIQWGSPSNPVGWWHAHLLEVHNEATD